jgi:hypothetical protein
MFEARILDLSAYIRCFAYYVEELTGSPAKDPFAALLLLQCTAATANKSRRHFAIDFSMKDSQANEVAEADAELKAKSAPDDEDSQHKISEATAAATESGFVSESAASTASPVTSTTSTTPSILPAPAAAPSTSSSLVHRRIRHLRSASYSSSPTSKSTAEAAANSFTFNKKPIERGRKVSEFSDFELLPPLENLLAEMSSLTGSMENDLLPSTPLTEEQLRRADSVLKEDLEGVPINCIVEDRVEIDGGPDEPWRYDIRGLMHNAAEQAEEFAIAIWHKLQSWKVVSTGAYSVAMEG